MFNLPSDPIANRGAQAQWLKAETNEKPVQADMSDSKAPATKALAENNERSARDAGQLKNLISAGKPATESPVASFGYRPGQGFASTANVRSFTVGGSDDPAVHGRKNL